jgi:hypothetical protein
MLDHRIMGHDFICVNQDRPVWVKQTEDLHVLFEWRRDMNIR